MLRLSLRIAGLAFASLLAAGAHAGSAWNEGSDGDLADDGFAPTALSFGIGSNTVAGSAGDSGQGIDRDYFRFVVPQGSVLTALTLLPGTSVSGGSSFAAIQAGPQLTVTPTGGGAENLLGFLHYTNDVIGTDVLPSMVFGYAGSLASGTYSFWVQDTGGPASYAFDFVVSAVPEPTGATALAAGLLALLAVRRRRR